MSDWEPKLVGWCVTILVIAMALLFAGRPGMAMIYCLLGMLGAVGGMQKTKGPR